MSSNCADLTRLDRSEVNSLACCLRFRTLWRLKTPRCVQSRVLCSSGRLCMERVQYINDRILRRGHEHENGASAKFHVATSAAWTWCVFAEPSICGWRVCFHARLHFCAKQALLPSGNGAGGWSIWAHPGFRLQQNFNLYIVNLFDTFHASKLLELPRFGPANFLVMYCDFLLDKRHQLADWSPSLLEHAHSDTHFLHFIYDNLRNALLDRTAPFPITLASLALDHTMSRFVYGKRSGGSGGWDMLARNWNKGALVAAAETPSGSEMLQHAVYRCVHAWQDEVARTDDESTRYVLPNHYLLLLPERPPADIAALPNFQSVPRVVRRRAKELLEAIRACLQRYLVKVVPTVGTVETGTGMEVDETVVEAVKPASGCAGLWLIAPGASMRVVGKSALFDGTREL
ncbi:hypothetical protein C8R43DRAFT_1134836 [Mycena crocata]|nr:hypothetical protein C8R43DRAFT_1134836 [Mycena crocata]